MDNYLEIVKIILSREKDQVTVFSTALELAVKKNNIEKNEEHEVITLLETILSYLDDSLRGEMCNEGLLHSVDSGSIPILQFFLDQGANINCGSALVRAISAKLDQVVRFLLDNGADCNALSPRTRVSINSCHE